MGAPLYSAVVVAICVLCVLPGSVFAWFDDFEDVDAVYACAVTDNCTDCLDDVQAGCVWCRTSAGFYNCTKPSDCDGTQITTIPTCSPCVPPGLEIGTIGLTTDSKGLRVGFSVLNGQDALMCGPITSITLSYVSTTTMFTTGVTVTAVVSGSTVVSDATLIAGILAAGVMESADVPGGKAYTATMFLTTAAGSAPASSPSSASPSVPASSGSPSDTDDGGSFPIWAIGAAVGGGIAAFIVVVIIVLAVMLLVVLLLVVLINYFGSHATGTAVFGGAGAGFGGKKFVSKRRKADSLLPYESKASYTAPHIELVDL